MAHYLRLVSAWLTLELAVALAVVLVLGTFMEPAEIPELGPIPRVAAVAVGGWLGLGLALAAVSRWFRNTEAHARFTGRIAKSVNLVLTVVVLACMARALAAVIPGIQELGVVFWLDAFFGPTWAATEELISLTGAPLDVVGMPTAPIVLAVLGIMGRNSVNGALHRLEASDDSETIVLPEARRKERQQDTEMEKRRKAIGRRVAVASYAESKAMLDATKRDLTFLALDVVGSTRMKRGEDGAIVLDAFSAYRELIERTLEEHGVYKQSWTPDGQLAAFLSPQAAVDCGQAILRALPSFNRDVSRMQKEFKVRIGAHSGTVSDAEGLAMDELSDFSIDVTGKLEKSADEDSIWISEEVYENLEASRGFRDNGDIVGGQRVYVWTRDD